MAENNVPVLLEKHRSHHSYFHVIVAIIGRLLADTPERHDALKVLILNETTNWFNNQQQIRRMACFRLVQRQFTQLDPHNQGRLSDLILTYYKCEQTFETTMREMQRTLSPLYTVNDIPKQTQIDTMYKKLPGFQGLTDFISEIRKKMKLRDVKSIQFKQKTGKPFEYDCRGCNKVMKLVMSLENLTESLEGGDPLQVKHAGCVKDYVEQIITRKDAELRKSDADKWTQVIMKEVRDAVLQQMQAIVVLSDDNNQLQIAVDNCQDLVLELTAENADKDQKVKELEVQLRQVAEIAETEQVKLKNEIKEGAERLARIEALMGIKAEIKVEGEEGEEQPSTSQQRGGQVAPSATVKEEGEEEEDPSNRGQEGNNTDEAVEALNSQMSTQRIE